MTSRQDQAIALIEKLSKSIDVLHKQVDIQSKLLD